MSEGLGRWGMHHGLRYGEGDVDEQDEVFTDLLKEVSGM